MSGVATYPSGIKSIQRGVITMADPATAATATIQAVNTLKTELRFLGTSSNSGTSNAGFGKVVLTNSTTVTASRDGTNGNCSISWELTEYY